MQADIARGETNLKLVLVHFKRQFIYQYLTSLQERHYYEVGKNVNRIDNLPISNSDVILFGGKFHVFHRIYAIQLFIK